LALELDFLHGRPPDDMLSRKPKHEPEERPGGRGRSKRTRGFPLSLFSLSLVLLAFLLAPACTLWNSVRPPLS
jgi:hypothetical protein